jgi:hypothetical protein
MKCTGYALMIAIVAAVVFGCGKNKYASLSGGTSLTIVNLVPGSNSLVTNFSGAAGSKITADTLQYYTTAQQVAYGSFVELGGYQGVTPIAFSPITDTFFIEWSGSLTLPMNTIHSLYLGGTDTLQIDTLFTSDNPPAHSQGDSSVGIRYINLSFGSNPISVDIQGNSPGSEVATLSYKGVTGFKSFPVTSETPDTCIFEFRDAATSTVLATYSMSGLSNGTNGDQNTNLWRWKNVTLVLGGLPTGTGSTAQSVFEVNDY